MPNAFHEQLSSRSQTTTALEVTTEHYTRENSLFSNVLPFAKSSERQVQALYGFYPTNPGRVDPVIACYGNYMASFTLRERRLERDQLFRASLDGFLDLPLDVIHEVFGWTHPIEMYNLIRTNKAIRRMLLRRNASSVWRTSYRTHNTVPCPYECPDYPKWTTFLFGLDVCEGCGCRGAFTNFCFRWKMCAGCTRLRCADSEYIRVPPKLASYGAQHFERFIREVLVSIQHSDSIFRLWTASYYRKRELREKTKDLINHIRYVEAYPTQIHDAYEAKVRKAALFKREARMMESWAEGLLHTARANYKDELIRSVKRMTNYLREIYGSYVVVTQTCDRIISDIVRNSRLRVPNKKAARKNFVHFKIALDNLAYQYNKGEEHRRNLNLEGLYASTCYQHKLSTVDIGMEDKQPTWKYFAQTLDEDILQSLMDDSDRRPFSAYMQRRIFAYLDEWLESEKKRLRDALAGTVCLETCTLLNGQQDAIRLATAIFRCCNHNRFSEESPLWYPQPVIMGLTHPRVIPKRVESPAEPIFFGWGQAYEHTPYRDHGVPGSLDNIPECAFSDELYKIMVHLLNVLGLDPTSTVDGVLDRLDRRFLCLSCPRRGRNMKGILPMRWRECAMHIYNRACRDADDHKDVQITVLTEEAAKVVRKYEHPLHTSRSWQCCWCNEKSQKQKYALLHAKEEHSITKPALFTDYYALPSYEPEDMIPRNAFRVFLDGNYCCELCPDHRKSKLWRLRDLKKHLKDRHGVGDAMLGGDYIQLGLISTTSCVSYQSVMDIPSRV